MIAYTQVRHFNVIGTVVRSLLLHTVTSRNTNELTLVKGHTGMF